MCRDDSAAEAQECCKLTRRNQEIKHGGPRSTGERGSRKPEIERLLYRSLTSSAAVPGAGRARHR